jgi:heterodisulfide reductase subunit A
VKATINAQLCDGCEKCIEACPADAISIMGGVASVNTPACKGCGACISSCHTGAIDLQVFNNAKIMEEIEAALEDKEPGENRILLFADDMCTYRLADGVGTAKMKYSPDVLIIRVPSSSRVTPEMMARAFELGADGIMLGECEPAVSPFPGTAEAIKKNVEALKSMLEKAGIETERVLFSQYVTVMFSRFVNQTNMMSDLTRKLGPIPEEKKKKLAEALREYKEAME